MNQHSARDKYSLVCDTPLHYVKTAFAAGAIGVPRNVCGALSLTRQGVLRIVESQARAAS